RQMQAPITKNKGFTGAGHAVYYTVTITHAFGHLLLLNIHHPYNIGNGSCWMHVVQARGIVDARAFFARSGEEVLLRYRNTHLREKLPADAINLRQAQLLPKIVFKHAPQPALKRLSVHVVGHLIFADYP